MSLIGASFLFEVSYLCLIAILKAIIQPECWLTYCFYISILWTMQFSNCCCGIFVWFLVFVLTNLFLTSKFFFSLTTRDFKSLRPITNNFYLWRQNFFSTCRAPWFNQCWFCFSWCRNLSEVVLWGKLLWWKMPDGGGLTVVWVP